MSGVDAEDRKSTWPTSPEKKPSIALMNRRCAPIEQFSSVRISGIGTLYEGKISKAPMLAPRTF